jgi:hypothetical protein
MRVHQASNSAMYMDGVMGSDLASLVLGDLVLGVLLALLALAVCAAGFGDVDLKNQSAFAIEILCPQRNP